MSGQTTSPSGRGVQATHDEPAVRQNMPCRGTKACGKDRLISKPVPVKALRRNVQQLAVLVSYERAHQRHTGKDAAGAFRKQTASRINDVHHALCSQNAQMAVVPQDHAGAITQSRRGRRTGGGRGGVQTGLRGGQRQGVIFLPRSSCQTVRGRPVPSGEHTTDQLRVRLHRNPRSAPPVDPFRWDLSSYPARKV